MSVSLLKRTILSFLKVESVLYLMLIEMNDRRFVLNWNLVALKVYSSSTNDSELWHKRLGHVNHRSMDMLYKHDLVENMSGFCEHNKVCEVG